MVYAEFEVVHGQNTVDEDQIALLQFWLERAFI